MAGWAQASRQHLPIPSFVESSPARQERGSNTNSEAATAAAVEQTMKKYMDDLMHMMESMTGRIGQLESSTRRLEQMVTEFKGGSDKNQGAAGGKLLLIETMLSEVCILWTTPITKGHGKIYTYFFHISVAPLTTLEAAK